MLQELLKIVYLAAMVIGIFVMIALWRKTINKAANRLCAGFIFTMLLPLWEGYASHTVPLHGLSIPFIGYIYPWLFGPMLLFYLKHLFDEAVPLAKLAAHFLPVPVCLLFVYSTSHSQSIQLSVANDLVMYAMFAQIFSYTFLCFKYLDRQKQQIEQVSAQSDPLAIAWINRLLMGFVVIFLLDLMLVGVDIFKLARPTWLMDIFYIAESLYIVMLGSFALKQPEVLFDKFVFTGTTKYQHSAINQSMAMQIAKRLNDKMATEKCYLDNELTLSKLAAKMDIAPHHLSQVLSEQLQQSFYEYINRQRVEHAKQLLAQNDAHFGNILDVAFEVGFNNKTSFNSAFKRFTQLTPSQFKSTHVN